MNTEHDKCEWYQVKKMLWRSEKGGHWFQQTGQGRLQKCVAFQGTIEQSERRDGDGI